MAVALQPAELTFVGIEVFHPELGCVRVRSEGGDRLHIDASDDARCRNDDFNRRVAVEAVAPCEAVVVPGDDDRGRALGERSRLADDRNEVAGLVEFCEEGKTCFTGLRCILLAGSEASGVDGLNSLVRSARVAGERDDVGVFGVLQVGPVLRDIP